MRHLLFSWLNRDKQEQPTHLVVQIQLQIPICMLDTIQRVTIMLVFMEMMFPIIQTIHLITAIVPQMNLIVFGVYVMIVYQIALFTLMEHFFHSKLVSRL